VNIGADVFEVYQGRPGYKTDAELDAVYFKRYGKLPPGAPPLKN
jgi:hypothetical protein